MPTPIHFQHKSGAVTYRIRGELSDEEEALLGELHRSGATPDAITSSLGRGLGAVASRLEKLGLISDWTTYGQ